MPPAIVALPEPLLEVDDPADDATSDRLPRPPAATTDIFWPYVTGFVVIHLLALLAFVPWLFSWTGVALVFLGNYIFGSLGINLAYHRILTHRGMVVPKWLEHSLALLGVCSLQDAPARWVAIHRMHHQFSDHDRDPHSPWVDFFWGHIGWLIYQNKYFATADFYDRYARDVLRDPFYMRLERNFMAYWVYMAHAVAIYLLGLAAGWLMYGATIEALQFGLSVFVWGVLVRTVYVWHITWAVNSVTHLWGYRNYTTKDHSHNHWMVALCTNGEGWHNNHHAQPRCAAHGHRWWEIDITYWTVLLLEKVGLARDVVHPKSGK